MKTLAERLLFARESKGKLWTQAHLATAAGVSTGTIGNLESGARGAKSATASLYPIAKALGVNYDWLATGEGEMLPSTPPQYAPFLTGDMQGATAQSVGTAKAVKRAPLGPELERKMERLLLTLYQVPESQRAAALTAALEVLIDHLPQLPSE